ncbi:PREDICTED: acetylcholinesterase-like [Branchiostoma belcheri]|uniref:Acetylcholinesterase-like n=1 Tax=Branchiostoma belcheri TaxID=7741 RepID=A0A6P4XRT1_BRABE|nr:PREDICTED: acetylcholinesterase-like [Branchiostoma belcheri]
MAGLVTVFVTIFLLFPALLEGVQVQTTSGTVSGLTTTYQGTGVSVFRGIPYAAPPVGPLRFRDPEPHPGWDGVRDATQTPPECPQKGDAFRDPQPHPGWDGVRDATRTPPECPQKGDACCEDCLYLNVYAPQGQHQEGGLAVMVYIHGGGFQSKSSGYPDPTPLAVTGNSKSSGYPDPTPLAVTGNVIVVAINYRLNVFGFLSTGDQAAPGNYGLMDQRFAMAWVKDNIRAFGGNPDLVTIYGRYR